MDTQETPLPQQNETAPSTSAEQIVRDFKPTSEVSFHHDEGRSFIETHRQVEMTDQEAFDYAVETFSLQGITSTFDEEQRKEIIFEGREWKSKENIGGFGITARGLDELEEVIPGVSEELLSQQGKIVFVGNGLSTAPVEILQKLGTSAAPEIVLVDLFDYGALHQDLKRLKEQFDQKGVQWPNDLNDKLIKSAALVEQIKLGKVKTVKYILGDGNPPEEMRNADLMVNSFGPPEQTLHEQIQCLKVAGRLFTSSRELPPTSQAKVTPIVSPDGKVASVATRVV